MNSRKKILLIGVGAIGSIYAYTLSKSSHDFAIVADNKRIKRYIQDGIFFCGEKINVRFITSDEPYGKADLILIAVKNYSLKEALDSIAPFVGENTIIIPLLNGISSEKITAERFDEKNVLYGYYIGHTSTRNGNYCTQDGKYLTVIGDYPSSEGNFSSKLINVVDILSRAGIKVEARADMITEIWKKFVVNVCLNQTTAFFECTYGEILKDKHRVDFFRKLAEEVQEVGIREEIKGAELFARYAYDILLTMDPNDRSSMAQDVMFGRKTEVEDFAGEVIRMAKKHGTSYKTNLIVLNHFQK